ncbi:MAG: hypothetical protein NWQ54_04800 [Paraglaciecola sp.]|nr:hypothetical protein [Paraglaciecola sp.]
MHKDTVKMQVDQDRSLEELLRVASKDELSEIANIITNNGKGRLSLDKGVLKIIEKRKRLNELHLSNDLLANEIRAFGSNTIANSLRRSMPVSYHEVLCNVAKKLGVKKIDKNSPAIDVEIEVLIALLRKAFDKKTVEEIRSLLKQGNCELDPKTRKLIDNATDKEALLQMLKTSISTYGLAKLIATALPSSVLAAGKVFALKAMVFRTPGLINPLGLALSAAWATYDISGPAYRVTIPAIAHIAFIRQTQIKFEIERAQMELKKCL